MYLNVFSYLVNRMLESLKYSGHSNHYILSSNPWPSKLPKKDNNWAQVVQVRVKLSLLEPVLNFRHQFSIEF